MDQQTFQLLTAVAGVLLAMLGFCVAWWVNNMWTMVKSQQEQISQLHVKLAENYMPRQEVERALTRIFDELVAIRKEIREHA